MRKNTIGKKTVCAAPTVPEPLGGPGVSFSLAFLFADFEACRQNEENVHSLERANIELAEGELLSVVQVAEQKKGTGNSGA